MQRYIHDTLHSLCVYYVKGKSKKKLFWQISEETYSLTKWSIQPQKQLVARDATIRSPHKCKLLTNRLQDSKTLEFVPTIGSEIQWSDLRKNFLEKQLKRGTCWRFWVTQVSLWMRGRWFQADLDEQWESVCGFVSKTRGQSWVLIEVVLPYLHARALECKCSLSKD